MQLTDEQSEQLRSIYSEHRETLKPHIEYIRGQPDRRSKFVAFKERELQIQAVQQRTDVKVQALLSPKQYETYVRLKDELRDKIREAIREQNQG